MRNVRSAAASRFGKNKRNNYMSSETTGTPQVCMLVVSCLLISYGIFDLFQSTSTTRAQVERAYLSHLSNWTEVARPQLQASSFSVTWNLQTASPASSTPSQPISLLQHPEPDRFAEIVRAEHMPTYENLVHVSPALPPGSLPLDQATVFPYEGGHQSGLHLSPNTL